MKIPSPSFISPLILFVFLTTNALAQTQEPSLMRTLQLGEITLTEAENIFYQEHLGNESTSSATLIWVGNILDYYDGHSVTFTVPNSNNLVLTADASYAQSKSISNYNWAGTINGSGYFMLNNSAGRMSGLIQTDDQTWTILPLRENYSLLIKQDMGFFVSQDGEPPQPPEGTSPSVECPYEYNTCPARIDVLLFCTSKARKFVGSDNLDAWIQWGENVNNFAFERSDIPNKRFRFRWIEYDPSYLPNASIRIVLDNFFADNFVNQSLAYYKADLAVLVTNEGFFNVFGNQVGGQAKIFEDFFLEVSPASRHCVAEIPYFFSPHWVLPHELTHLIGARHNAGWNVPCGSCGDDYLVCEHGYRFHTGDVDRLTIHGIRLASNPTATTILNYSNPDVTFLGEQTGYIMANNASILRKNGCFVAGYAISQDFNIALVGATVLCHPTHGIKQNYSVTIIPPTPELPGVGPYTVEWWQNTSGIFTYQSPDVYLGSGQQIQVGLPPSSPCPFFFIHVKVTSADGVVLTSTRKVVTDGCAGCTEMRGGGERFSSSVPRQIKASITPNPSSGYLKMEMFVEKQTKFSISLYDARGELIRNLGNEILEPGEGAFERNIEGVSAGFYWVTLVTEDQKTNLPLIILK